MRTLGALLIWLVAGAVGPARADGPPVLLRRIVRRLGTVRPLLGLDVLRSVHDGAPGALDVGRTAPRFTGVDTIPTAIAGLRLALTDGLDLATTVEHEVSARDDGVGWRVVTGFTWRWAAGTR